MAQSHRIRLLCIRKQEHEIHIIDNPLDKHGKTKSSSPFHASTALRKQSDVLAGDDYQAPLTADSLQPDSRWLIVRRNLHRIRFMGLNNLGKEDQLPNLYLGFQMTRELKRAQDEIKNIDKEKDFHILKEFSLSGHSGRRKVFDTRHVGPNDALIYDRLGEEPLALQNLLYYFSKQEVQHGTVFWDFLNEVNQVLNLRRKRTVLVQRLRRLALTLAIIFYCIVGFMFSLMLISVIATAAKSNDPEVKWVHENIEEYNNHMPLLR
ncbi:unnamed protein product [Rotaria sp. Silwood2]|nr:unnamed protein product [Rotaria sp. Silwood2]CAF2728898.1 unnamed protein product [Rotaria sp. Silwood2]CAF3001829.1 unnamed protein product [Rotaria sp. Silwood2]CAF3139763.1 unnamed protein product [Rotaria sp. Silwood2]CAF4019635.1 unnamed protein product [Rotaria sp. Silwood2]